MRTFIAIDVGEEARAALLKTQGVLRASRAQATWVKPEAMHLTLRFLGEVAEAQARKVAELLPCVAANHPPCTLRLGAVGAFPTMQSPRVVWVGLQEGAEALQAIYRDLESQLTAAGFSADDHPFHPHITLGRIKGPGRLHTLKTALQQAAVPYEMPMVIRELLLFQSVLDPTGPHYTCLHRAVFSPSTNAQD